jgi:tetratricopeptide (TPR) repeat protein
MAIDCFSKSSSNPETQYESLKYLALINRITGNYEQAFEYVNQNLDAYPDDRDLLLEKGKLFSETSQYDSALTIFHQLIAKDTADIEPLYQSALVHYQRRWYDSALYYTGKTLQLDDRHFPSMLTEARVYDRRTYYGTSMRKYQEILDIDSSYTPAVEELTYLRGKVAYLQKIRAEREANSQVEIISPTKPPN